MPVFTHPLSAFAADLFDALARRIGVVPANRWMFSANADLDGASPIGALKAGRIDAVKRAFLRELSQ